MTFYNPALFPPNHPTSLRFFIVALGLSLYLSSMDQYSLTRSPLLHCPGNHPLHLPCNCVSLFPSWTLRDMGYCCHTINIFSNAMTPHLQPPLPGHTRLRRLNCTSRRRSCGLCYVESANVLIKSTVFPRPQMHDKNTESTKADKVNFIWFTLCRHTRLLSPSTIEHRKGAINYQKGKTIDANIYIYICHCFCSIFWRPCLRLGAHIQIINWCFFSLDRLPWAMVDVN